MSELLNELKYEDLTEDLQMISDVCGMDTVRNLVKAYGGMNFYIPKFTRFEYLVYRYISNGNSKTIKQLAKELGVSEQYIRTLRKKFE